MHNTMKYKTYIGSVEFDEEKEMFFGSVLGIRTQINYQGQDADALVRDFHRAVDDYFADAQRREQSRNGPIKAHSMSEFRRTCTGRRSYTGCAMI